MRLHRTIVATTFVLALPAAAGAATEADCERTVAEAQQDIANDGALESRPEGVGDRIQTILAEASEAGLQGNANRCLELVRDARGEAGLQD